VHARCRVHVKPNTAGSPGFPAATAGAGAAAAPAGVGRGEIGGVREEGNWKPAPTLKRMAVLENTLTCKSGDVNLVNPG
jgi:hypothetical protein